MLRQDEPLGIEVRWDAMPASLTLSFNAVTTSRKFIHILVFDVWGAVAKWPVIRFRNSGYQLGQAGKEPWQAIAWTAN